MTDVLLIEDYTSEELERMAELERLRTADPIPLKRMVDEFRDGTEPGRIVGEMARRYFDGNQLDGPKLTALKRAHQPRVIRNEIKPAINGLLGILVQAKVDPKAYPRNPDNEEQADVASKALRYVADANRMHKVKIDLAENHLIEGLFSVAVEVDDKGDVVLNRIRYDEAIYDPRSREADFSDARFKGVGKWLYEQDVARLYPDFEADLSAAFAGSWGSDMGLGQQFADKPDNLLGSYWMDRKKRRLFIVELYHREDEWMRSVFYVGGVLEQGPSPYLDDDGEPMCPIVMGSCYIDGENQRYGVVRSMLSPQDELNAYSSRALHLANSRQLQASDPNFPPEVDAKTASIEASKANGVIPPGWSIVPTSDLFAGINVMMQDARQALVRQAPTPAVLAEASAANQSGRSRLVLQQAGMTEVARAFGRLEDGVNEILEQSWLRLKQFKTEAWWLRITGDDGKQEFVGVNMPADENGEPIPPEMLQMMQAQGMQPPQIKNELARMDVDIEIETIPDTANLQAEQFEALAPLLGQMAEAFGVKKAFEVGLALSSVPEKGRIKEMLEDEGEQSPEAQQAAQMQAQMQQLQAQLGQMAAEAQIEKDKSAAALNMARANAEQADTVLKAAQFQTGQGIDAS